MTRDTWFYPVLALVDMLGGEALGGEALILGALLIFAASAIMFHFYRKAYGPRWPSLY